MTEAGNLGNRPTSTFTCLGVKLQDTTFALSAERIVSYAKNRKAVSVHFCNAYTLTLANHDAELKASLETADSMNLPDGAPVAWVGRLRGSSTRESVRGASMMEFCLGEGIDWGARHVFYGSTPAVLQQLTEQLRSRHPGVNIVEAYSPPFRPVSALDARELLDIAIANQPHYIWVGLGTPKQDQLLGRIQSSVDCPVLAVGAAFEFAAGMKKEAPGWLRGTGLEWVHRLATEPRRLWRRYLIGNVKFLILLCREVLSGRNAEGRV